MAGAMSAVDRTSLPSPDEVVVRQTRLWTGLLVLVLIVWVAWSFWPIVFGGQVYFWNDIAQQNLPFHRLCAQALRQGRLPLWIEEVQCGFPLLAEGQAGFFYPIHLLLRSTLDWVAAFNWIYPLHWLIGAVGMWTLSRISGRRPLSAGVAAGAFVFGGYWVTRVVHTNNLEVAAWLPWGLATVEKAMATRRPLWWTGLALVVALQHLAGYPQITLISLVTYTLVFGWRWMGQRPWRQPRSAGGLALGFAGALALGTGLAALQLLPTATLLAQSVRAGGVPDLYGASVSLPPRGLVLWAFPYAFGWQNAFGNVDFSGLGPDGYWEYAAYAGWLVLLAAGVGVGGLRRRPEAAMWLVVAAVGVLIALGPATPLWQAMRELPGLRWFRGWSRYLLMTTVGLCQLAACGLDGLLAGQARRTLGIVSGLAVVGTAGLLYVAAGDPTWGQHLAAGLADSYVWGPLVMAAGSLAALWAVAARPQALWPSLACLAVLVADLTLFGFGYNHAFDVDEVLKAPVAADVIRAADSRVRYLAYDRRPAHVLIEERKAVLAPNVNLLWDVPCAGVDVPLTFRRHAALAALWTDYRHVAACGPILRAMNVGFITTNIPPGEIGPHLQGLSAELVHREPPTWLWRLPDPLGRAWLVSAAQVVPPDRVASVLGRACPDLGETAVVEAPLDEPPAGRLSRRSIVWEKDEPEHKRLRVTADRPCLLVLSQAWYPGWHAWVDGAARPIVPADGFLQAVPLDGRDRPQQVELRYEDRSLRAGIWISGAAGLVWLAAAGVGLRRQQRRSSPGGG